MLYFPVFTALPFVNGNNIQANGGLVTVDGCNMAGAARISSSSSAAAIFGGLLVAENLTSKYRAGTPPVGLAGPDTVRRLDRFGTIDTLDNKSVGIDPSEPRLPRLMKGPWRSHRAKHLHTFKHFLYFSLFF
uniref:Arogenate dehydratase n=1 Tax=Rhizophora mucronata TaxID=61149 RepID=A0A2P2MZN0_RHIMU